ncbi:MAG TPA: glycerophosphodiester phosphodiesterase [Alphaproteobacteria bacterium]|nr:glycerophosphodiester phosphodiesterase [Alphaproteobacteria bacterium]
MAPRPNFDRPVAHRGLHDRAAGVIENSRSAFEAAIAKGYAIECDVQVSSDGVPIIFHDDDLERLTGLQGPLVARTAAELTSTPLLGSKAGDCPQTLTEFLDQIGGRALLQIELKRQRDPVKADILARTAAEAIARYSGPVTVESFDPGLLVRIRRYGYNGPLGIITEAYDHNEWDADLTERQRFVLRHLLHWPWSRFSFISCSHKALDLPAVKLFHALGMPVTAWTVRSAEERRAVGRRADQIVFEGFDPQGG